MCPFEQSQIRLSLFCGLGIKTSDAVTFIQKYTKRKLKQQRIKGNRWHKSKVLCQGRLSLRAGDTKGCFVHLNKTQTWNLTTWDENGWLMTWIDVFTLQKWYRTVSHWTDTLVQINIDASSHPRGEQKCRSLPEKVFIHKRPTFLQSITFMSKLMTYFFCLHIICCHSVTWLLVPFVSFCLQVLRYLLPASRLPEQNDAHASGSDDRRVLGYSHLHLFPAHHAGLEQHRHRPPGERCSACACWCAWKFPAEFRLDGAKLILHSQDIKASDGNSLLLSGDGVAWRGGKETRKK